MKINHSYKLPLSPQGPISERIVSLLDITTSMQSPAQLPLSRHSMAQQLQQHPPHRPVALALTASKYVTHQAMTVRKSGQRSTLMARFTVYSTVGVPLMALSSLLMWSSCAKITGERAQSLSTP